MSHHVVVTSILLSLVTVGLAGCVGNDEVAGDDDGLSGPAVAVVSETTGSIKGTVASELFEPRVGADVTVLETGEGTRVNTAGEFVFNELEPGRYTLVVNALGYKIGQRVVDVVAGEVARVQFLLEVLPSNDPWVEPLGPIVGKITYAYSHQLELPVLGCMVIENDIRTIKNCGGARGGDSDNGEIAMNVSADAKTVVAEMVWDPAGPLGEYLAMDVLCPDVPRGPTGAVLDQEHPCYFPRENSQSPIHHRIDEEHWLEHGYQYEGDWAARVFSTYGMLGTYDSTGIDIGVAYEQSFTIYANIFHKEPAPEGFSGIPDL